MSFEVSARLGYFHQDKGVKTRDLMNRFPNYLKSNIYIHEKVPDKAAKTDGRKLNKGKPKVLTVRDVRMLMLKEALGSFSIKRLKPESGVDPHISENTIILILKRKKYHYLQYRNKSLMSRHDARTQLLFPRKLKPILSRDF